MCLHYGVSVRQACATFLVHRSAFYYRSRKSEQVVLKQRIKDIALSRNSYGYRRVHTHLLREGFRINHKRVYRLYCELSLQMRKKKPKRRIQAKAREDRLMPVKKNDIWSMDFVSDALFGGRKLRILTIVDVFTRESPLIGVGFTYKGHDVVQTLEEAVRQHGYPMTLRIDNGPEFISKDLDLWAYAHGITLDFSRPGKPTDNSFIESFNSRFRQECLNQHWFLSLEDAKKKIQDWWREYNSHRPHSSLGYLTPKEFADRNSFP
jgi:putative transposase